MVEEIKVNSGTEEAQPVNMLDRADALARRIEEANKKTEELIARQEAIAARQMLAGRAEAGSIPAQPKELNPVEYANAVREGKLNPLKPK